MLFSTRSVVKLSGLTYRQVDYWDRTHFIEPSFTKAAGSGNPRFYSFNDLVQLKVAKTLLGKGISIQKMRKSIMYLKENFHEIERPPAAMKFLTDGEMIFMLTNDEELILKTFSKGQTVFVVAIGEIVEKLKEEVEEILQNSLK